MAIIRPFELGDYSSAFALWQSLDGIGFSQADSFEGIAQFLARNPSSSFVAVEDSAIVGTVLCGHDGRRGLIHHLAVARSRQRGGIGRTLVRRALEELRAENVHKCHVLVFRENAAGRAFWARLGADERVTLTMFSVSTTAAV